MANTTMDRPRQPAALFKLCFVEVWERFGFVTLMAVAALFFASPVNAGGLGWSNAEAVLAVGYFAALLMTLPMIGGWLADSVFGAKKGILFGGVLMAIGYLALGLMPLAFLLSGVEEPVLRSIFSDAGLALARPDAQAAEWALVAGALRTELGAGAGTLENVRLAYDAQSIVLVLAFVSVACGNALFKPSVSATVGTLYAPGDIRRDGGFTLFWTFINAGSLLAYIVGGGLGERFGWNVAFLVAFLGMAVALAYFAVIQRNLPEVARHAHVRQTGGRTEQTQQEKRRLGAIGILVAFAVVFHACHGQIYGLIGLFILQDVDRNLGGFEIPALWVTSMNPFIILLLAPAAAMLWDYLGRRGRNPSFAVKFVWALLLLAVGQVLMWFAATEAEGLQKAAVMWVVIAIIAMSVAEFPLQPIGLSMVTRLAPARLVGVMMGSWLLGMAIAGAIGGNIGALSSSHGLPFVFAAMTVACVVTAIGLLLLRRFLDRWMALEEAPVAQDASATPQLRVG